MRGIRLQVPRQVVLSDAGPAPRFSDAAGVATTGSGTAPSRDIIATMVYAPAPKLRWYQYRLRTLLLLMLAVSLVCSWLAVRWERQRRRYIVRVVISCPGYSAAEAEDFVSQPYRMAAMTLPFEEVVAISSEERCEFYFVARGVESNKFLDQVRGVSVGDLPSGTAVEEVKLLDRGANVPQVESKLVDALSIDLDRTKMAQNGVSVEAISKAVQSQGKAPPTKEGVRRLQAVVLDVDSWPHGRKIRLGDIAEIRIVQQPSHVVWQFPPGQSESPPKGSGR